MSGGITPRRKGARYENDVVQWLRAHGLPHVERRIFGMGEDRGDITGWPGVVLDCKAHKEINLATWMDQLNEEALRACAEVAALIIKRRRRSNVGEHYVVMEVAEWLELMREAGRV